MGMFNWVRFETNCPMCFSHLKYFQTKDKFSELVQVKPHKVTNFYTSCHNCKAWVNYYKEHGSKKWTRTVYMNYFGEDEKLLDEHTKKFSKKHLKAHTTEK